MPECPYKDFRGNAEYMEKFGFIEKNGGYYYTKADGTAVLRGVIIQQATAVSL